MFIKFLTLVLLFLLVSCNSGNVARNNSNSIYGKFNFVSDAPFNVNMAQLNPNGTSSFILTNDLFSNFVSQVICNSLIEPDYCNYNISYIAANTSIYGVMPVSGSSFIAKGVRFKILGYTTLAPSIQSSSTAGAIENVSGLVVLPTDANGNLLSANLIKGVLLYFHETIASKTGNPSGYGNDTKIPFDRDDMSLTFRTQYSMAAIFAANGYIVVAPDYLGNGINYTIPHPYILAITANALSGIYMLTALKNYLFNSFGLNLSTISKPYLYISSYSEGGSYAVMASRLLQGTYSNIVNDTGLTLKHTFGISGAYDMTNTMLPYQFTNIDDVFTSNKWLVSPGCNPSENINCNLTDIPTRAIVSQFLLSLPKPLLSVFLVNSFIYYNLTSAAFPSIFLSDFYTQSRCFDLTTIINTFSIKNCGEIFGNNFYAPQLFDNNGLSFTTISFQIAASAIGLGYIIGNSTDIGSLLDNLTNNVTNNSISTFIYRQGVYDPTLLNILKQTDNYNFTTNNPITLINLKYDSVVTPVNTKKACNLIPGIQGISKVKQGDFDCIEIDNTQLWGDFILGDIETPIYMQHEQAASLSQLIVLNKIIND